MAATARRHRDRLPVVTNRRSVASACSQPRPRGNQGPQCHTGRFVATEPRRHPGSRRVPTASTVTVPQYGWCPSDRATGPSPAGRRGSARPTRRSQETQGRPTCSCKDEAAERAASPALARPRLDDQPFIRALSLLYKAQRDCAAVRFRGALDRERAAAGPVAEAQPFAELIPVRAHAQPGRLTGTPTRCSRSWRH